MGWLFTLILFVQICEGRFTLCLHILTVIQTVKMLKRNICGGTILIMDIDASWLWYDVGFLKILFTICSCNFCICSCSQTCTDSYTTNSSTTCCHSSLLHMLAHITASVYTNCEARDTTTEK